MILGEIKVDGNKICFIIASNDKIKLRECITYIKKLIVPKEYIIEMIIIREAPSMTKAYNTAMKSSTAKYKVYLHQDLFIIYKDFIKDFTDIFMNCPKLGMIGVAGTKHLQNHAIWCGEKKDINFCVKYVGNNTPQSMCYSERYMSFDGLYQKVEAIDGMIMITQYDIPWREDIFDDWHFYDMSQSVEFSKAGYDIGVTKQKQTWCLHKYQESSDKIPYFRCRNKFIEEYM